MKVRSFALCAAAVVAMIASAASAFSFDAVDDVAFFQGQALTMGRLASVNAYAKSSLDASYSECASCGDSVAAPVVFDAGIPAAFTYDAFAPVVVDDFVWGYDYAYNVGWNPVRTVVRPVVNFVDRVRPVRRVLSGVRNLFVNDFDYCRPAYVCDPCWSCEADWTPVEEPCFGCGIPAAFAPVSVFAPKSCCGYDYYPGEVNELDPETGLAKEKRGLSAALDNNDANSVAKPAEKNLSTDEPEDRLPTYDNSRDNVAPATVPADDEELIPTPTPDPNLTSGVIRMLVPEDAVVYVNGYRTKQKGELRSFAARELEAGQSYSFEIRVVATRDGRVYEDVQTTTLTAGESTSLAFNLKLRENEVYAYNR